MYTAVYTKLVLNLVLPRSQWLLNLVCQWQRILVRTVSFRKLSRINLFAKVHPTIVISIKIIIEKSFFFLSRIIDHKTRSIFFDYRILQVCTFESKLKLLNRWGEVLILFEFISEYQNDHLQKNKLSNTPARYETGFGFLMKLSPRIDL